MRVLVTGAGGFLGRGLAARLVGWLPQDARLVLTDRRAEGLAIAGADIVPGDLADPAFQAALLEPGFDLVFHLASLPGSLAEREQEAGLRINLLAPIALAALVAARRPGARFVFASSIAVYGALTEATVSQHTPSAPLITYGAHKRMIEVLLEDMTRRGALSAVSVRFPGLVARPPELSGHGSAFMSQLFHHIAAGQPFACPIPAESSCWWMSRRAAVEVLLRAAQLEDAAATVVQPPVLHASLEAVADATARVTGRPALITWGRDEGLRTLFGAMPALDATPALSLGFHADADLEAMARAALSGDPG
ncbi:MULTISPECIES: NAD-dependent epimerase/dehydratase family protein [Pseudoxanthomonas]|uniref:Nucleoside-diphosphate-sugar epimerase n=1 Tax=Pseudoxanthomonas winnipegensis TaxID=2480810 RepID=A0AAW8GDR3_9GAMM|nr:MULTISPECIES: NAD-dependent epimerase/dehydratase family protein [Pseudoxanthomonas]MDQ1120467.1 nucleoside-diphosphate-sugar epimerase [Pseudoxanthomonas winnipegensis]MDQ1133686.1 nucleoside-diphosphate-sugar epimerase [Pseudoxanthomonas winnipegensis]MDR6140073.1 nucleoside-diphosphate-sugar epimerase [Pseudoxanthomonas sp. SORGH_AS_0997]